MFQPKPDSDKPTSQLKPADILKRADSARDRRDWPAAANSYRAYLSFAPEADGIWVQLGHALKENGDFAGAEAAYQTYFEKQSDDADIHLQFGHLFSLKRDLASAQQWYESALRLASKNGQMAIDAKSGLRNIHTLQIQPQIDTALLLTDTRQFEAAKAKLVALVEAEGREELVGVLGNVCKELYEFDAAAEYYKRYFHFSEHADHLTEPERAELVFDANLQCARLEKLRGNFLSAVLNYQKARDLLHVVKNNADMKIMIGEDQKYCLAQITSAFRM
jgi:tetratricopeptide (TPR) repeat protein